MNQQEAIAKVKDQLHSREEILRESWVRAMETRLVQEELGKCQRGEGVNHYENCRWLADKYLTMLRENRVKGYKQIDI
ncbi:NADH-ubiquinone oxidoreductase 12 kDa subunit [Coprinopsis marcescibilis]|uniref:NADH-ubiquinone oxidoreductase 12 kDa subunit n=1 Tax=Coprinopsis marcescibilis TaxID=230819 RepID=A0A5C3L2C8_COPMA|nr:NADH-ubiquinone oxidoreductase 12 kDa subunit [Coprinopsis marcescibilis]